MGTSMNIYEIVSKFDENVGFRTSYNQIETIIDNNMIDQVIEECERNWHVSNENGFIGELTGKSLAEILNVIDLTEGIDFEEIYRVEVNF